MKKSWKILGIVAAVFILILCLSYYIKAPVSSEIVKNGVLEDSITAGGFVAQDEYLITSDFSGALQNSVLEGETVSKGQKVAVVYKGKVDQKIQSALALVQQKIEEFESAGSTNVLEGDGVKLESQIKSNINQMISASHSRQFDRVRKMQTEIYKLSDKMQIVSGSAQPTTLAQLQSEKQALEQQINLEKADLYAPESGVYSSHLDGLENLVDYKNVSKLTVADYSKLENAAATTTNEVVAGQPVAKVVHDFDWQFITVVDASVEEKLNADRKIQIRIPESGDETYWAQVTAFNPDENGKALMVVGCNKASKYVSANRKITMELIFEQYSGLKIPTSALQEADGKQGVFVKKETFVKFKEVEVLAEQDGFAIVKENNLDSNNLLLYDDVVTRGRNLYDGKVIF